MHNKGRTTPFLIGFLIVIIAVLLLLYPNEGLQAALRGVSIWWDVLFPALFPFFVISEMLLGFGIVHWVGTMLDPMMRPVFRVPGIGGFVMAMGFASGYPVAAKLTSQIWEQKLVNRDEAERLVAFTTSSDPIFLIGAVSVGFFHDVSLAPILAISHYGGAIIIGLLMRFHGSKSPVIVSSGSHKVNIWKRAFEAMHMARVQDGRPIGILLSQAIQHSLSLVFVVGGLVVFFSVVLEVLTAGNIMQAFYSVIEFFLRLTGFPSELSEAVIKGLFEVTIGAKAAGSAGANIALVNKLAIAAFVLSWAGLSVHAQIVSLISHTNMRYAPFIIARLLHGLFSAAIIIIIWKPMQPLRNQLEAFLPEFQATSPLTSFLHVVVPSSGLVFLSTFLIIAVLYIVHFLFTSMYRKLARISVKP